MPRRLGHSLLLGGVMLLTIALLTGCGVYRSTVALQSARQSHDRAQAAGASRLAVYEYTLGVEYLKKAREEVGYADYSTGEALAKQAESYLKKATKKARAKGGEVETPEDKASNETVAPDEERILDDDAPKPKKKSKKRSSERRESSAETPDETNPSTPAPEEGLQPEEEVLP